MVVFVCTYPLSEKTKCQFSLILILDQPQYNLSCNTKAGNGKQVTMPIATFNTLVGLDGMLREGRDQHFVSYILKMGLILVIHVSFHNTSFAGLTTIVIVYALILIMTEIKCKNCNCNETLNIFTPSKVYLYGCVKFS